MMIELSGVQFEIILTISKLNEYAAQVGFEIISLISAQNYTTQSSIITLLHPL